MHTFIQIALLVLAAFLAAAFVWDWARGFRRGGLVTAINSLPGNVGTSHNSRRYKASGAVGTRYFLGKIGADDEHVALVAAASDKPVGVMTDEPAAAEDPVNVELLGVSDRTLPMVAAGAIALEADVYSNGDGKVQAEPAAAGTYWKVGKAATAAGADNDPIEVVHCTPERVVIVAALTAPGTAAAVDLATAEALANACKADLAALAAALATPSRLKVLA